jgi:hypothetical protein
MTLVQLTHHSSLELFWYCYLHRHDWFNNLPVTRFKYWKNIK